MKVAPLRCLVLVVLRITSWWSSENVCWWYFVCAVCLTGIQVDFAVSSNGSVISVPLDLFHMFVWPLSTFIQLYPICVDSVCLLGRGVGWCLALSNFLCLLRAIFSPLIQGNLSVCRCMAIFFIMFCGMFNTAFYSISFKVYSHTLGLYFFPLYGNSSCGSLGSGSDGVSIDLQFYTLLSALPFLCFG